MPKESYQPRHRRPSLEEAIKPLGDLVKGVHEACQSVTKIGSRDFDNLVDSIKIDGLLTPIEVDANRQLIDGRSRIMACYAAGVAIKETDIKVTKADPWAIARSNDARRHLTVDQRAMAATRLLELAREQADQRKRAGKALDATTDLGTESVTGSEKKPVRNPRAMDNAAKAANVPREKLATADKIRKASPEIANSVERGDMSLSQAAEQTNLRQRKKVKTAKGEPVLESNKPKAKDLLKTTQPSVADGILFTDDAVTVRAAPKGLHIVTCPRVTVYHHKSLSNDVLVYTDSRVWWYGPTSEVEHEFRDSREQAELAAESLMSSLINQESRSVA